MPSCRSDASDANLRKKEGGRKRQSQAIADAPSRRSTLVAEVKALKALPEAERPTKLPTVMKAFQKEIDWLTKRAQFAEDAFTSVADRYAPDDDSPRTAPSETDSTAADASVSLDSLRGRVRELESERRLAIELVGEFERVVERFDSRPSERVHFRRRRERRA